MFLIHLLPTALLPWAIGIILSLGIIGVLASTFIKFIPPPLNATIELYRIPLQIISTLLLVYGVYFTGGVAIEKEWRAKVAVAEARVTAAEKESKKVNTIIVEKIVERIKYVKEKQEVIIKQIPKYITAEVDAGCKITDAVVQIHDAAALNNLGALK